MALTRKLFYISIFTSNHFRTQTRREREREEITGTLPHTELHPLPHAKRSQSSPSRSSENFHSPQKISLVTHSHHSRQAQAEGWRELSPVKPRSSPRPMAPSVWSRRSNPSLIWSRHLSSSIVLKPISDEPGLIVLAFASAARSYLYIKPSRLSLSLLLSIWPNLMNFFFFGFCFLCVSLFRNDIIYLFGSWENVSNK